MARKNLPVLVLLLIIILIVGAGCSLLGTTAKEPEPAPAPAGGDSTAGTVDAEGYTLVQVLEIWEGEPLVDPAAVALAGDGSIYISDAATHKIYRFNQGGELAGEIGSQGRDLGQLVHPADLFVDSKGTLYVADQGNNRVQILSPEGDFLGQVGSREEFSPFFSLEDGYDIPLTGVAADDQGNVWLTLSGPYYDISDNALRQYTPQGELVLEIKSMLQGDIDLLPFTRPGALTLDREGTVYMVHGANGVGKVIKVPFQDGGPLADEALQFGSLGKEKGELMHTPQGIAIDSRGNIFVADTHNNRVQVFDPQGEWLLMFRLKGTPHGELAEPGKIAIDGDDNLYLVDRGNARVLKIANPLE